MKNKQNYLFPVIATGKIGSSPMDCEDVCSLITSSSKYCSLYVIFIEILIIITIIEITIIIVALAAITIMATIIQ